MTSQCVAEGDSLYSHLLPQALPDHLIQSRTVPDTSRSLINTVKLMHLSYFARILTLPTLHLNPRASSEDIQVTEN